MQLRKTWCRLKLASQFTLLLTLIFVVSVSLGGCALSKAVGHRAEIEISDRAQLIVDIMSKVNSPNRVFEQLQKDWKYKDFIYRSAALNPTDSTEKADLFEAKLIEKFQSDRTLKALSGFRKTEDGQLFYSSQPLASESKIIGTRIIYLPANEVFSNAHQALFLFINIFSTIFAFVLLAINYLLKHRVIQPLKPMVHLATQLSLENVRSEEIEQQDLTKVARRGDELGQLGRVFQKMVREICDREEKLSAQIHRLRIEIDQTKRRQQVAEIEESDYFQKLQQEAKRLRSL